MVSFIASAQKEHFEYYTIKDGLAQSRVKGIVQDKNGYLWFATNGGVSRFDGVSFRSFTTKEGIINNRTTCVFESSHEDIWVTTLFGLSRIEFDLFQDNYSIQNIDKKSGLTSNAIFSICQENDSIVWVGTARGINKLLVKPSSQANFKREAQVIEVLNNENGLLSNSVNDLLIDKEGNIWLSYIGHGVSRFDISTKSFEHFGQNQGFTSNTINDLFLDDDGNIWCASGNGVNVIVPNQIGGYEVFNSSHINALKNVNVRAIVQDFNGDLLLGANKLYKVRVNNNFIDDSKLELIKVIDRQNGLKEYAIQSFCQDHEKNIWMGTFNFGAVRYGYSGFQHLDESFQFSSNRIQSIYEDSKNRIWIGTNEYINVLKRNENQTVNTRLIDKDHKGNPIPKSTRKIFEDSRGHIWIGTTDGLLEYINGQIHTYTIKDGLSHNYILDIYEDSQGTLWFATFGGVSILNRSSRMGRNRKYFKTYTVRDGLPNNQITAITEDNDGNILLGTRKGLVRYDGYVFENLSKNSNLSSQPVITLKKGDKGLIWIVFMNGIGVFDGDQLKRFNTKDGLNSDSPYLLEIDDKNHVWVGTNKGLNEIIFDNQYNVKHVKHYGLDHGVISSELNQNASLKDSKGVLWFGTQTGIVKFDRRIYCPYAQEPIVKIDRVRIFLKDSPIPEDHEYSYDQNHITFDFIGFSFSNPEKIKYQYMLEGIDKEWFPVTTERFATWSNLPPGRYKFLLKSMSHNGVWTNEPVSYSFRIVPPFWKTNWFRIMLIAIVIASLYLFMKLRLRRLENARAQLQDKVALRTQALNKKNDELIAEQEKNKKNFRRFKAQR